MNTHSDFEEFLRSLTEQCVEFVIVGGCAVAFHGYVRATQDMDLFFRNTEANVRRSLPALRGFGLVVDEAISSTTSVIPAAWSGWGSRPCGSR